MEKRSWDTKPWLIMLSKIGVAPEEEMLGKASPRKPSKGAWARKEPGSDRLSPNTWFGTWMFPTWWGEWGGSGMPLPHPPAQLHAPARPRVLTVTVSYPRTPTMLPVPYQVATLVVVPR